MLDCTLRDGGYCNEWRFGENNIKKIVKGLTEAGINIIECGFLTNRIVHDSDITRFNHIEEVAEFIPKNRADKIYCCMINYGEYNLADINECDRNSIDALRIAFHKKNMIEALDFCRGIKQKGYKCFVQAMVSLNYSDQEFLDLIHRVNEIMPYAFYIVDSFGVMKRKDLIRLFYIVEHNLKAGIAIGYHAHNNMQLAYSNAQSLADLHTKKEVIIDTSVYGMGRGAGNLNTELFVEYLNDNFGAEYQLSPILNIIDEVLNNFYERRHWGYSLPNYLSAHNNAHPNYAKYFVEKQTLTFEDMNNIFNMMDVQKKVSFDRNYAERIYVSYLSHNQAQSGQKTVLSDYFQGKKILLIAPGKSALDEKQKIIDFSMKPSVCTISVNHDYPFVKTEFIFLSNLRRYRELEKIKRQKCIVTSNIFSDQVYMRVNYSELIGKEKYVSDNAGMMALRFLISCGVKEIYLAGFDGYSRNMEENYINMDMALAIDNLTADARNQEMDAVLSSLSESISIFFLTTPKYIGNFIEQCK